MERKIDIYSRNSPSMGGCEVTYVAYEYVASTNMSKTCKEAIARYAQANGCEIKYLKANFANSINQHRLTNRKGWGL